MERAPARTAVRPVKIPFGHPGNGLQGKTRFFPQKIRLLPGSLPLPSFPAAFPEERFVRKALGEIVFHDAAALRRLNAITHRYVGREVRRALRGWAMAGGTLAGIDAIALIESGISRRCTAVLGITAPAEARVARLMAREGISEAYARSRIAAQPTDAFYRAHCTEILENTGSREAFARTCAAALDRCCPSGGKRK